MPDPGKTVATEWGRIDLNLLIPLNALLIERNVTKAAERIFVTQPSMSAALAKLRRIFDDPLLVREGRGLVLTPFAESLRQPVQNLCFSARDVLTAGRSFDPAHDQRTFTIVASDYTAAVLLPPVLRGLSTAAPGVRVKIEPLRADFVEFLRAGRCDLMFWPMHVPVPELMTFPHTELFGDDFIVAADADNDLGPLTAEELAAVPCVRVAALNRAETAVDRALSPADLISPTVATADSFTLALQLVSGTNLVALVQRRLFALMRDSLRLREVEVTADLPAVRMGMFWHPRTVRSPAHQWLRDRVQAAADAL